MVDDCPMSSIAASMFIYILSTERWKKLGTQLYSWSWVDLRMKSLFEDWHPSPPVTKFSKFLKPSTALKANNITHILSRYKLVSHLYQCQLWRWTVLKMLPNLFFWKQYCSISGETGHSKGGANWKEKVSHLGHLSHLLLKLTREYLQICMTKRKIRLRSLGRHQACSVSRLCFVYFFITANIGVRSHIWFIFVSQLNWSVGSVQLEFEEKENSNVDFQFTQNLRRRL